MDREKKDFGDQFDNIFQDDWDIVSPFDESARENEREETIGSSVVVEKKKFYDCAQLECFSCHLGLAVAMKNFWVYHYDNIQKQKVL